MRASQEGHEGVCELLIQHGADVNRKNLEGMNSLMLASQRGLANMVTFLINNNAYVDDQTSQGSTALMLASKRGHQACVEVLVFRGAEIYMKDLRGRTARDTATKKNFLDLLNILDTQKQVQMIQQDLRRTRNVLLYTLRTAYENNTLYLDSEERRAMHYLRSLYQRKFSTTALPKNFEDDIGMPMDREVSGDGLPFAHGGKNNQTQEAPAMYSSGLRPVETTSSASNVSGAAATSSFGRYPNPGSNIPVPQQLIRRHAVSASPVTSISSTPPIESEDPASADNSPIPYGASAARSAGDGVIQPQFDKFSLPENAKATICAEFGCFVGDSNDSAWPSASILKPRGTKSVEWEWPLVLMRCIAMPKEIFELIVDYMPSPRIWQWSLSKLRNRAKLAPHPALDDVLVIIDELLCDANLFNLPQQNRLLIKLNSNPEVCFSGFRSWHEGRSSDWCFGNAAI
jgi:hypothetical protein